MKKKMGVKESNFPESKKKLGIKTEYTNRNPALIPAHKNASLSQQRLKANFYYSLSAIPNIVLNKKSV